MQEEIERVTAQLQAELAHIADKHGVAVVTIRPKDVASNYDVNVTMLAKALRRVGFWCDDAGTWRNIAGAAHVAIAAQE